MSKPRSAGRSGPCYEDTHPTLHAICSGSFARSDGPTSSPEERMCTCPCHTPEGADLRASTVPARPREVR